MSGELPQWWLKFSNLWKREKIQMIFRLLRRFMLLKYPDSMEDALSDIYCSQETIICTWSVCFKLQIFKVARQSEASHSHDSLEELERPRRWGNENDSMDTAKQLATDFEYLQRPSVGHGKEGSHLHPRERRESNMPRARYRIDTCLGKNRESKVKPKLFSMAKYTML